MSHVYRTPGHGSCRHNRKFKKHKHIRKPMPEAKGVIISFAKHYVSPSHKIVLSHSNLERLIPDTNSFTGKNYAHDKRTKKDFFRAIVETLEKGENVDIEDFPFPAKTGITMQKRCKTEIGNLVIQAIKPFEKASVWNPETIYFIEGYGENMYYYFWTSLVR